MNLNEVLTADMVEEAERVIRPFLAPTRLLEVRDTRSGRRIFLKLESEQPTGSFKVRGALSNLLRRPENPAGFVTASAGNHALGVAWAAQQTHRKERVTIFVPASAPKAKLKKLAEYAIDLRVGGDTFDDAERAAHAFERSEGAQFIHAYDDPLTAAGQGTMVIEISKAIGTIGTLIVPVGGGGMISGIAAWRKERQPTARVVAVQPDASPALSESIRLGRALLEYPAGPTLADGLSGGIGHVVFAHRHLIDEVVNVPEHLILEAVRGLFVNEGVRAEASGAITRAALEMNQSEAWPDPIVCIITGSNIDETVLRGLID